jgi:hypothetical protein
LFQFNVDLDIPLPVQEKDVYSLLSTAIEMGDTGVGITSILFAVIMLSCFDKCFSGSYALLPLF